MVTEEEVVIMELLAKRQKVCEIIKYIVTSWTENYFTLE